MAYPDQEIHYHHVYYVTTNSATKLFKTLAIGPTIKTNGLVEWSDASRGAYVFPIKIEIDGQPYKEASNNPKKITFTLEDESQVILEYLTLDMYVKHVQAKVSGNPSFKDTEELQKFYLSNF